MKKSLIKVLALLMVAAMVFSLAACGKDKDDKTTTEETTVSGNEQETTAANEESTSEDGEQENNDDETTEPNSEDTSEDDTTDTSAEETTAAPAGMPTTKAEILKAYTDVMNKAKNDKPAHKKKEFQALPKKEQKMEGVLIGAILPLAETFMTKEDKAETYNVEKGNDMKWFPVYKSDKGCLLTNANAIQSADCEELADGNYKITIVLKDEKNPEPYKPGVAKTSNTGSMFSPLSSEEINDTLLNDKNVKRVVKNVKYDLRYYNCTAELVYNPKTNEIVKLDQYMFVFINIQDGKAVGMTLVGTAVLENTMRVWDFKY